MKSNSATLSKNDRGQVGIGTLIIFIAMVLVAAVAAGVLINTSGALQAKAQDTGKDAQAQVSNQIDVISATGAVDGANDTVDNATLVVKKSPGSDAIDLSKVTIYYVSDSATATLNYTSGTVSATQFTATKVSGSGAVLETGDERISVVIDIDAIEAAAGASVEGLGEGKSATLKIVDQSGATTTYVLNAPETFGSKSYVEL